MPAGRVISNAPDQFRRKHRARVPAASLIGRDTRLQGDLEFASSFIVIDNLGHGAHPRWRCPTLPISR